MGRPAAARATFIAREGWAQDRPEPPTQSPVKYPRGKTLSSSPYFWRVAKSVLAKSTDFIQNSYSLERFNWVLWRQSAFFYKLETYWATSIGSKGPFDSNFPGLIPSQVNDFMACKAAMAFSGEDEAD